MRVDTDFSWTRELSPPIDVPGVSLRSCMERINFPRDQNYQNSRGQILAGLCDDAAQAGQQAGLAIAILVL